MIKSNLKKSNDNKKKTDYGTPRVLNGRENAALFATHT
jgi:hypothetical protein